MEFTRLHLRIAALGGIAFAFVGSRLLRPAPKRKLSPIYKAAMIRANPEMIEQYFRA